MKSWVILQAFLLLSMSLAGAGTPATRTERQQLTAIADSQLAELRDLTCLKTVARFHENTAEGPLHLVDVIDAVGGYVNGRDEDALMTRNGRQLKRTMRELKGSWSTGEFGALLAEEAEFVAAGMAPLTVTETPDLWVVSYRVPAADSMWDLEIGGRHFRPGYEATVSVNKASNQITAITRYADDMGPGCAVAHFAWTVRYEPRRINQRDLNVPVHARYENCQKATDECDVNEIVFTGYREFRAEANVTFAHVTSAQ